jgi:hypothetical protein
MSDKSKSRIWVAPVGSSLSTPLGELENGDLVVPEDDGVRIWPELKGILFGGFVEVEYNQEALTKIMEEKHGDHSGGTDQAPPDIS